MSGTLVLYEDSRVLDLSPLTDLLPVPALAFGSSSLGVRWLSALPAWQLVAVEGRPLPLAAWRESPRVGPARRSEREEALAINAAALPGPWVESALAGPAPALWVAEDGVAGARLPFGVLANALGRGAQFEAALRSLELPEVRVAASFLRWPWELMERNPRALAEDLASLRPRIEGEVHAAATVLEPDHVRVEPGARVDPQAVLDAREGPILLGPGVRVAPGTWIEGPCAVGERTELLGGAIGRSTIGPQCRIAGEVDGCVWQGWSNKRHHGFVGHSVVGEWVNLGALTTTSDLKNTYGRVRVWAADEERDTGLTKVGSFIGSHAKTGIGTLLPTGAWVGTGSNLFGAGRFAPRRVPPFTWWDGERAVEHRIDRFLATAAAAMTRRGRRLGPEDEALLRALHGAAHAQRPASTVA